MPAEVTLWVDYVSPYAFVAKASAYELERAWLAGRDQMPWPTHVQVDRDLWRRTWPPDRLEFPGGQHLVERAGQRGKVGEHPGGGEHYAVVAECAAHGSVGRHRGEEVAQAERPQQQDARLRCDSAGG